MTRGRRRVSLVTGRSAGGGTSAIRAAILAQGGGLALLGTQKERNIAVRTAMLAGGQFYMRKLYHRRFTNMAHARRLGYSRRKGARRAVFTTSAGGHTIRDTDPLVNTGQLAKAALERYRVDARSTKAGKLGGKARALIKYSRPHAMKPQDAIVLRAVSGDEVQAVARVVGQELASILASAQPITSGRGKRSGRRTLTGAASRLPASTVARAA
jgi:hypothetical protein